MFKLSEEQIARLRAQKCRHGTSRADFCWTCEKEEEYRMDYGHMMVEYRRAKYGE